MVSIYHVTAPGVITDFFTFGNDHLLLPTPEASVANNFYIFPFGHSRVSYYWLFFSRIRLFVASYYFFFEKVIELCLSFLNFSSLSQQQPLFLYNFSCTARALIIFGFSKIFEENWTLFTVMFLIPLFTYRIDFHVCNTLLMIVLHAIVF